MDKKIVGLAGAIAAAVAPGAAQALPVGPSVSEVLQVQSYGDLLEPIPNARAVLNSVEASAASQPKAQIEKVQYHHHHHHTVRRVLRHLLPHHHHHHYHHHHHHHYD